MFADDTLIYISGDSSTELESKMNMALEQQSVNKLKMNTENTEY